MLKSILLICSLLVSTSAIASENIKFIYENAEFHIPANISALASVGDEQNVIIVKYGDTAGQNFIGFTDMTKDSNIDFGCSTKQLIISTFGTTITGHCNQEGVLAMRANFVENSYVETWSINNHTVHYSRNKEKSFVFITDDTDKVFKIDSDFLTLEQIKVLVAKI